MYKRLESGTKTISLCSFVRSYVVSLGLATFFAILSVICYYFGLLKVHPVHVPYNKLFNLFGELNC